MTGGETQHEEVVAERDEQERRIEDADAEEAKAPA